MKVEKATIPFIPFAIQVSQAIKAATGKAVSESRITVWHTPGKSVEVQIDGKEVPAAYQTSVRALAEKLLAEG